MKDIPGFPGYKITEEGKLYNPRGKLIERRDEWQGYPRARLKHESGKFVNRKIHTLVALAHLGEGKEVRHLDNNRANFHLHNLEWGDRLSNAQDRLARGSYHLKTKLVKGKSFLDLGDDKYLDPEKKKVYHVTDHPLGEEGIIPVDSLEKVAWTSKRNADKHALKHAESMGLTKEQYIALAKAALKDKRALISVRGDVHKSRHGKNILVHKDDKVITYFAKTAYLHKIKRHIRRSHKRASKMVEDAANFDYNQDIAQSYIDSKDDKKK